MSKKKSAKAAPKAASPAPKTQKTSPATPSGLVSLGNVELKPSGRTSKFDEPAKALIAALESGQKDAAFAVATPRGLKPVKTYLYNAMQKSLRKARPDNAYRVSVRTDAKDQNAYISISPRNEG